MDDDDDGFDMDDQAVPDHAINDSRSRRGTKKPETEEEKRRNFLERNRQGTLSTYEC